jgi:hypothetical protein
MWASGEYAAAPAPGVRLPPPCGLAGCSRAVCGVTRHERDVLQVTAFGRPAGYAEHCKARYGPMIRDPRQWSVGWQIAGVLAAKVPRCGEIARPAPSAA